ncbi:MAG: hypothetical protein WD669_00570 [Pirellulales bacterium]
MKRMMIVLALAGLTAGAGGCCCCRGLWPQTAVVAPAPAPACPPAYDPCATPPMTYGPPPAAAYPQTPVYTTPPQW